MENVVNTKASDSQKRFSLSNQTLKRHDPHRTAEEETLFLAIQDNLLTRSTTLEALEWHRSARRILNELVNMNPNNELWLPNMLVARSILVAYIIDR